MLLSGMPVGPMPKEVPEFDPVVGVISPVEGVVPVLGVVLLALVG